MLTLLISVDLGKPWSVPDCLQNTAVDSMPAVVTSIEKPASVTVIRQEVADVVVSLQRASDVGKPWSVPCY
jgi:hypothetical protein